VRDLALAVLVRVEEGGAFADILLDRLLRRRPGADARDRALATELVMGTLRRRGTLDFALAPHLDRPLEKAGPAARSALRLGAYQLLFMRVPARAAVHETVEALKRAGGERQAGFVNAVLRAVARAGLPPWPGDPAARLAARGSAPPALVEALVASLGEAGAERFLAASLEKPPFAVRVNPFRTEPGSLARSLAASGADPVPCRYAPGGLVLRAPRAVHADPAFARGEYVVMDEGAQLVASLLDPRPGERILDACAAPGGKTLDLAALAGGAALLAAADVSAARVRILEETLGRLGVPNVQTAVHDLSAAPFPAGRGGGFDKILLDAPCSGTGVIRRNPDAKWRFHPARVGRLARLQAALLRNAFASLRPGGLLLYCTCSVLTRENEEVVRAFAAAEKRASFVPAPPPGWPGPPDARTGEGFVRLLPHLHGTDGFFAALIRRKG